MVTGIPDFRRRCRQFSQVSPESSLTALTFENFYMWKQFAEDATWHHCKCLFVECVCGEIEREKVCVCVRARVRMRVLCVSKVIQGR